VPADLRDDWSGALAAAGFAPDQVTVWIAEGLLYYLSQAEVDGLLDEAWRSGESGSVLVTDVAPTLMRDAPQLEEWRRLLASYDEPFRSFSDDGASLLTERGWDVDVATSIANVAARVGYELPGVGALGAPRLLMAYKP
jgi:methyltransferase (TIGR00027 family)